MQLKLSSTSESESIHFRPSRESTRGFGVRLCLLLLVLSFLGVLLLLYIRHVRIESYYSTDYYPALNLQAEVITTPRDIELYKLSRSIELKLITISTAISSTMFQSPDHSSDTVDEDSLLLQSNDEILSQLATSPAKRSIPFAAIPGYDSNDVAVKAQFQYAQDFESLYRAQFGPLIKDSLRSHFGGIARVLKKGFRLLYISIPDSASLVTLEAHDIDLDDSDSTLVTFLYCALFVDTDTSTEQMRRELKQARALRINRLWHDSVAIFQSSRSASKIPPNSFVNSTSTNLWYDTFGRPSIYVGFPAAKMSKEFDLATRPWFHAAHHNPPKRWTPAYRDVITNLPVLGAVQPIFAPDHKTIVGVVSADVVMSRLIAQSTPGWAHFLNMVLLFVAVIVLGIMILASGEHGFDWIHFALVSLYSYYLLKTTFWAILLQVDYLKYFDFVASLITSITFLVASWVVFADPRKLDSAIITPRQPSMLSRLENRISRHPLFFSVLEAIVIAVVLAALSLSFNSTKSGNLFRTSFDACFSCVAMSVFSIRYLAWTKLTMGKVVTFVVGVALLSYSGFQLAYAVSDHWVSFWLDLALLKLPFLAAILYTFYRWSKHRNLDRIIRLQWTSSLLRRLGTPGGTITMAGEGRRITFLNETATEVLNWKKGKNWKESNYGDGLCEPSGDAVMFEQIFGQGEHSMIALALRHARAQSRSEFLATPTHGPRELLAVSREIRDIYSYFCPDDGTNRKTHIHILSIVAWYYRSEHTERPISPWYSVGIARVISEDEFETHRKSRDAHIG